MIREIRKLLNDNGGKDITDNIGSLDRLNLQLDQTIINEDPVSRFYILVKCLICDSNLCAVAFKIANSKYKLFSRFQLNLLSVL